MKISKIQTAHPALNRQAFDTLYRQYANRVLVFARQLTGNQADAEDLTQEVFVAAFDGIDRFEGRSPLLSWLLAIAVRRWRDRLRHTEVPVVPYFEETEIGGGHPPSAAGDMADQVISALAFNQALCTLSLPLREAFLLVAVQGLTHREAAAILERPIGTIKWRVAEAVKQLRKALTAECH